MYSVARGCSVRRLDPEPVAVLLERAREGVHVRAERHALLAGGGDRPVVHVGQVHDVEDLVAAGLEPAPQQVLEEERPEVPDVGVVVDRGPAGVQRDPPRLQGDERLDAAGEGVVEAEGHPPAAPAAAWATGIGVRPALDAHVHAALRERNLEAPRGRTGS